MLFTRPGRHALAALVLAGLTACAAPGGPALGGDELSPAHSLSAADGLAIAVAERSAARDEGGPTLVLLHGWSCDRSFWGQLPERLAVDHRVVVLDLPGHGDSGVDRDEWSVLGLGEDVAVVCDALALEDVVLVGHSMGATVALSAARALPGRVRGVLAVDSLHDLREPVPPDQIAQIVQLFEDDWETTMTAMVGSMVPAGPRSPLVDWILERTRGTDRDAALGLMRSFSGLDLAALAQEAAVPVRAVNAAPDPPLSGPTHIEANQERVDYDAVLVEGVGHYLQLEKPDAVEAALREFLAELEPAGASGGTP